jgi:hypothetical protein
MPPNFGKVLIAIGLVFVAAGIVVLFAERFSFFRIGRLPGDIVYRRGNFSFYFPWVTSLLVSLLLTLLFWIFGRR